MRTPTALSLTTQALARGDSGIVLEKRQIWRIGESPVPLPPRSLVEQLLEMELTLGKVTSTTVAACWTEMIGPAYKDSRTKERYDKSCGGDPLRHRSLLVYQSKANLCQTSEPALLCRVHPSLTQELWDLLMTEGEPELARGELVAALHLTDAALAADAPHAKSLEARLQALQKLRAQSHNSNESGCLDNKLRKSLRKDYTKNVELDPVVPDIITSAVEPNENFIVRVDSTHGQHY